MIVDDLSVFLTNHDLSVQKYTTFAIILLKKHYDFKSVEKIDFGS